MITASVVIYKTPPKQIENIMESIINADIISTIYIIDNFPTSENERYFRNCKIAEAIEYIPNDNTGYGSSHNIAIQKAINSGSKYHLVLNPDIYFDSSVLKELQNYMDMNLDVGYIIPKVVYPNGDLQYLCKLLPTPIDLIFRRFLPKTKCVLQHNYQYELRHSNYNNIMNPPCLSGCFMFLRVDILKENNLLFDDSFFMYCEDFDLIRRIHRVAKTVYYPKVFIVHDHAKESYKNKKMLKVHIKSAIHYFNKWGWIFDKERTLFNNQILEEIEEMN